VVLVRKHFPKMRRKKRDRYWKLKHMAMEVDDGEEAVEDGEKETMTKTKKRRRGKKQQPNDVQKEKDYELFKRDLEEDDEMRKRVNIY